MLIFIAKERFLNFIIDNTQSPKETILAIKYF
jgi:hypothetical protein